MCFCLWFMQYNSMKRNMAVCFDANKQTEMMQKMMLWIFPIMYIFSGIAMPFAVLVYWLTNNICNLCAFHSGRCPRLPDPGSPAAPKRRKSVIMVMRMLAEPRPACHPSRKRRWQKAKEAAEVKEKSGYQRQAARA